jgi:hypothetical protein
VQGRVFSKSDANYKTQAPLNAVANVALTTTEGSAILASICVFALDKLTMFGRAEEIFYPRARRSDRYRKEDTPISGAHLRLIVSDKVMVRHKYAYVIRPR